MDTRDTRVQNLLFLLSAAPIGLGCIITSDDVDTDATPTTAAPTGGETDTPTTDTPTTTEAMTTGATGDTTEGPADTTEGSADTTAGEPMSEACEAYADRITECYMDPRMGAAVLSFCLGLVPDYEAYGPDCVAANEEYLACLTALSCEVLMSKEESCVEEFATVDEICVAK